MLAGGAAGALVVVVVLAVAGVLGRTPSRPIAAFSASRPADPDAATRLAASVGHGVVAVLATTPLGVRRSSGVCVQDGQVVTSAPRVAGATSVTIVTLDGTSHPVTAVASDPVSDLAVLRVGHAVPLDPVRPTDSDARVGQWVVAVGGGDGRGHWVATGVIAAMGGWVDDGSGTPKAGLITTDAALPDEALGGALLDQHGSVVGILAGTDLRTRAGFATPVAVARDIADQVASTGSVEHGGLGVQVTDVDDPSGARVATVMPSSPAARAQLAPGDVIRAVDGEPVDDAARLVYEMRRRRPGTGVELRVQRAHSTKTIRVVLGTVPGAASGAAAPSGPSGGTSRAVALDGVVPVPHVLSAGATMR